jgi:PKD repeat protein
MVKLAAIIFIAFIATATLFAAVAIPNACAAFKMTVRVYDLSNGNPIAGATVQISGPESHVLLTDADGLAVFNGLLSGSYQVTVKVKGYPVTSPTSVPSLDRDTVVTIRFGYIKAFFVYNPPHPSANQTVTFDASLSNSTGVITSYDWDFGDGTTGTGLTTTHSYKVASDYPVTLNVTSTAGPATYTRTVTVLGATPVPNTLIIIIAFLPFLLILLLLLLLHRRHYYVIIQVRVPLQNLHPHCPGNNTICEDCKLTPC